MNRKDKIKYLKDIIVLSDGCSSLEEFVDSLKCMQEELVGKEESCRAKIVEVLEFIAAAQPNTELPTFDMAKRLLNSDLKKGIEESYLAYLTKVSIETKDCAQLKRHLQGRYLKDIIILSTVYKSSMEKFVDALRSLQEDLKEADGKETCRAKTAEVLEFMNTEQPGANIHTFNKARMYLNIELKKGLEESYLAYLTKIAIDTKNYSRLKKHLQGRW